MTTATTHLGVAYTYTIDVDEDGYTLVIHTNRGVFVVNVTGTTKNLEKTSRTLRNIEEGWS